MLVQKNLRSEILCCPTEGVGGGVLGEVGLGKTKITKCNVTICVEKDVLRLQVPVHNVVIVQVLQRKNKLCNVKFGARLLEATFPLQMPEKFSARHVIGDQIEIGRSLEGELEADNKGRVGHGSSDQNVAFAKGVCNFLLLNNDLLGQDLHGVNASSIALTNLEDLAECALANELQDLKVFWAVMFLVDLGKVELEVDLARDCIAFAVSGLQRKPAIIRLVVLDEIWTESDVAKEGFAI